MLEFRCNLAAIPFKQTIAIKAVELSSKLVRPIYIFCFNNVSMPISFCYIAAVTVGSERH